MKFLIRRNDSRRLVKKKMKFIYWSGVNRDHEITGFSTFRSK